MIKHYLKSTILTLSLAATSSSIFAQSPGTHGIEANFGLREYIGDMGSSLMFASKPIYQGGGLAFTYYINPSIDAVANLSFGEIGYTQNISNFVVEKDILWRSFRAQTGDFTLGARYKLNNNIILSEESKFAPYVYGGVGAYSVNSTIKWGPHPYTAATRIDPVYQSEHLVQNTINDIGMSLQGGLGFKVFITQALAIQWSYTLTYTFNDRWDGANDPNPNPSIDKPLVHKLYRTNDAWGYHALGFSFALGESSGPAKLKDKDEDGVPDKYDKCKNTMPKHRKFVDNVGCPVDTDGDGMLDGDDECIDKKGSLAFNGCPDTDNDSIPDRIDACPTAKGSKTMNGCPDSDNDGVADKEDRCPASAGLVALKGCPDKDGDGVSDLDDKCIAKPGSIDHQGCPDSDGDGVFDNSDRCPDKPGSIATKGCPEIKADVVKKIALAAKGINFETSKATIIATSFKNLDQLADILNEFPEAQVEIQGHTDNVGDAVKNKTLSQERANAVKEYLQGKGIDASRMTAMGYGSEMPIADNTTPAGKAKNRRVDFKLNY